MLLVVAADDRVQPQTIEAINHARAAEVPLIVAVNKVDKPDSSPQRIEQELLEHNLVSEGLGGDTIMVPVSAKTGDGIDNLLEMVLLQAEVLELKAFYDGPARGAIIESKISRGKGAVGTELIQRGILRIGDFFLVGTTCGRVRAMFNDHGQSIQEATPAVPVEITGFDDVPTTGETFIVMDDERTARQLVATFGKSTGSQCFSAAEDESGKHFQSTGRGWQSGTQPTAEGRCSGVCRGSA